ncbi:hypothetical protein JCM3766R1_004512 [Sporobolomyces carnicolor]
MKRMEKLSARQKKQRKRTDDDDVNRPFLLRAHHHPAPVAHHQPFDAQRIDFAPKHAIDRRRTSAAVEKRGGGGTFKGVSSYYLFALDDGPRRAVLDAIKRGGFSVVRIFLSGVHGNCKGSGNGPVPDLEPDQVGEYDDTILYKIDKLMADCADRGLKLMIALSDRYALGFWSTNSYAIKLNIVQPSQKGQQSLKVRDASAFYSGEWAIEMFEKRIEHALNHENGLMGGTKWKDLSSVVYAFEAQNEPQGYMTPSNPSWVCDRSNKIASLVSGSGIKVSSGGGTELGNSLGSWATQCGSIDIVSVHDYGTNGVAIANRLARAKSEHPDKTIVMGEWGLTGSDKANKIKQFVDAFEAKGISWMYWQVTSPGAGSKDFEVWTSEPAWGALTGGSYSYSSPDSGTGDYNGGGDGKSSSSSSSAQQSSKSKSKGSTKTPSPASTQDSPSTMSTSTDGPDGNQYSTVSPDQLSGGDYSIVAGGDSTATASASNSSSGDRSSTPTPAPTVDPSIKSDDNSLSSPASDDSATVSNDVYSTISPDDLSGYSIVNGDGSLAGASDAASPSLDSASTSSLPLSSELPTETASMGGDNGASLLSSAPSSTNGSSPSAVESPPAPTPAPSLMTPAFEGGGEHAPLPNCNFTLVDTFNAELANGTISVVDANRSIAVVTESQVYCNSTILPSTSSLSDPAATASLSSEPSPLLVFSSDTPQGSTEYLSGTSSPSDGTPPTVTLPHQSPENDTTTGDAAVPTPSPSPHFEDVTLDANALLTMDLSGYEIVS